MFMFTDNCNGKCALKFALRVMTFFYLVFYLLEGLKENEKLTWITLYSLLILLLFFYYFFSETTSTHSPVNFDVFSQWTIKKIIR